MCGHLGAVAYFIKDLGNTHTKIEGRIELKELNRIEGRVEGKSSIPLSLLGI